MSKYEQLQKYLAAQTAKRLTMQIGEIEAIIADKLPASAYRYVAWWSNGINHNHTQCRAWLESGYRTVCVQDTRRSGYIIFEKQ